MKEGANPEMDRIAKLVSGRLKLKAAGPHPDPDLLTAFAEHALPDAERAQLIEHLGACSDCREVLYLAMPDSADAQQVLSFRPSLWSGFALRWGTLMASVVILTCVLVARYSLYNTRRQSPAAVTAPAVSTDAKISEEKVPPELNAMRHEKTAQKVASPPVDKERPEAKHMTAKPQASLDFEDSGRVRVLALPHSGPVMNVPLHGRNVLSLDGIVTSTAKPSNAPPPSGGESKDPNALGFAYSSSDLAAKEAEIKGNLGGIISDSSGAVVGKATVTMVGPAGVKTATSDSDGRFAFDQLTPGLYSIKAEANGFKSTEIKQVAVVVNKPSTIRVTLDPGSVSESVEVSATGPAANEADVSGAVRALDSSTGSVAGQEQTTAQLSRQKVAAASSRQPGAGMGSGSAMPVPQVAQWTLSPEGIVQRSFDTGKSWQTVSVSTGTVFRALSAVGSDIWVGGRAGALYHSADSGQTWAKFEAVAGGKKLDQDIVRLDFSDARSGTVNTANGEVWRTSDGGQTWLRK